MMRGEPTRDLSASSEEEEALHCNRRPPSAQLLPTGPGRVGCLASVRRLLVDRSRCSAWIGRRKLAGAP
jgi:hypothetical protein